MPFNERGEWKNTNPIDTYISFVTKSETQPGSGGILWNSDYRKELHDQAARYYMELHKLPDDMQNFESARKMIEVLLEKPFQEIRRCDEKNGFCQVSHSPKFVVIPPGAVYRHEGD
ncbi:MAG: hypothetical protein Q7R43_04545 [Candidatus Daviesbacteria bacterium]|nr:hypothetical protein [Candidatus Daviesbacteria bacterium]